MRASLKAFAVDSICLFALGTACAYAAATWVGQQYDGPSVTLIALNIGALVACSLFATLGGAFFWRRSPLFIAVCVVALFLSGNPAVVILSTIAAWICQALGAKLRQIIVFYFGSHSHK